MSDSTPNQTTSVASFPPLPPGVDGAIPRDSLWGQVVADRFEIIRKIDEGGMGVVYDARDLKEDRRVALKFIRNAEWADEGALERFEIELRTLEGLDHPNLV